jgi:hypothetical protein
VGSRKIREEREACCDDSPVELCADKLVYARALLKWRSCASLNRGWQWPLMEGLLMNAFNVSHSGRSPIGLAASSPDDGTRSAGHVPGSPLRYARARVVFRWPSQFQLQLLARLGTAT